MKKIILTVSNDLNFDQRMIRICSSLSNAGYEVVLVGRKRKQSLPLSNQPFQQKRLNCIFDNGKLFYLELNIRLFFFLISQSFEAVCAIDLDTILPCFYASKLKGKRLIFDAHEYFTEVPEVVDRKGVKMVWEAIANHTIPKIKLAYTVGEELANLFHEKYGIHFYVIRNVPFNREFQITPKKPPVVLYQGALNEGRGLEQLILAFRKISNAQLWIAGEGDLSDMLRQLVKDHQLEEKVNFLGYLKPDKLKEETLKATIGLNLLENRGLSYYYSLANKAFDYIQVGLPSIQMEFPEYIKLQEQFEVFELIPNLEEKHILNAINTLLTDKDKYQQLANNCLIARKDLNWEIEEKKLINLYKEFLS